MICLHALQMLALGFPVRPYVPDCGQSVPSMVRTALPACTRVKLLPWPASQAEFRKPHASVRLQERINRALVNSIEVSPDTDDGTGEATTPGTRAPAGEATQAASQRY